MEAASLIAVILMLDPRIQRRIRNVDGRLKTDHDGGEALFPRKPLKLWEALVSRLDDPSGKRPTLND
jgi:hypothetical protein